MAARPRILLAPVTVSPTKPLTPSHLKGLLWTDVMYRATAQLADVCYRYSPTAYHRTEQTLGFWEYLDRTLGDTDYSELSEDDIGNHYVQFRARGERPSVAALAPYADALEQQGWTHPASTRVLELWTSHYARLGLHDPGLLAYQPPGLSVEEMIERLCAVDLALDLRRHGGPVYLDATRHGLPLRQVVSADGAPNLLACALRDLMPLLPGYDEVVLLHDPELTPDYGLLQRILSDLGGVVHRVAVGRVPIDGQIRSARHGDWRGHHTAALLDAAGNRYDDPTVRLGVRLYFIASLGPGQRESFRPELLRNSLVRAARLVAGSGPADPSPVPEVLARHRAGHVHHVDPYRLTSSLLARSRPGPSAELLSAVYL